MANKKKTKLAEPCKDILNSYIVTAAFLLEASSCDEACDDLDELLQQAMITDKFYVKTARKAKPDEL
jgi:hypothetical protein